MDKARDPGLTGPLLFPFQSIEAVQRFGQLLLQALDAFTELRQLLLVFGGRHGRGLSLASCAHPTAHSHALAHALAAAHPHATTHATTTAHALAAAHAHPGACARGRDRGTANAGVSVHVGTAHGLQPAGLEGFHRLTHGPFRNQVARHAGCLQDPESIRPQVCLLYTSPSPRAS